MSDEQTADSEQNTPSESTAENTAGDSHSQEQTSTQDQAGSAAADSQAEGSDKGKTESDNADSGKQKEKPQDSGSQQESKPKPRRSAQYRIEQLARENADLRKKNGIQPKQDDADETGDGNPPPDDQHPDISKQVQQEVDRRLAPVLSEHSKAADDAELSELFTGDKASERSKYEQPIREMWKLPQYKDVAASDLFKIAAFDQALASAKTQAVEDYKKAQKEAKDSSGAGNSDTSNRTGNDGNAALKLSDEAFIEHNNRVKAGLTS